jgi:hypothetical protein
MYEYLIVFNLYFLLWKRTNLHNDYVINGIMDQKIDQFFIERETWLLSFSLTENIEWFIEDQAFLLSYDLFLLSLYRQQVVSLSPRLPVCRQSRDYWRYRGRGTKSYDGEKAWFFIHNSILSGNRALPGYVSNAQTRNEKITFFN